MGPYGSQRQSRERSKATLGLGLDEDYHSPDRHEEEGTLGQWLCKAQGHKSVYQERTSEEAAREARRSWCRPVGPNKEHLDCQEMGSQER